MKFSQFYGVAGALSSPSGKYPLFIYGVLSLLPSAMASAAPAAAANDRQNVMVVTAQPAAETGTGPVYGYVAKRSTAGTKTDTPLIKTPQSISVVTRDQMTMQNVQSVAQALRYTSGIASEQRGANTDSLEYLYARGFLVDQLWNGLYTPGPAGGFGFNVTSFDPYMFERIEVLHGPASVLYGQGSPGGVVNMVSKLPDSYQVNEVGVQTGSYGRRQGFFDIGGALDQNDNVLFRVVADGFASDTQTKFVEQKRFSIAPSLAWQLSDDTRFTLYGNYQTDPDAGYYNSFPLGGQTAVSRRFNPGEPDFDSFRKTQGAIGETLTHRINDVWSVKQSYRYLRNNQTVQYVGNDGFNADGTTLKRTAYLNTGSVHAHTLDNQATAAFSTGALSHQATFGVDYQHIDYDHWFYSSPAPGLNVSNPQYGQSIPAPDFLYATSLAVTLKQLGVYGQDQIDIGNWSFLLGMREDWADNDTKSYKTGEVKHQADRAFTWRLGSVYQFDNGIAPFVSYSQSFQPQVGADFDGHAFTPSKGEQYEAGVKFQPKQSNSFITLSLFQLTKSDVATSDPQHQGFNVLTGEVRSRGIEAEAHASLSNHLQLIGSYTYTDITNTESTTATKDKAPVGIPRNAASLWMDYSLYSGPLAGWQFGAGARYIGGSYGDSANSFTTSSATLVDIALRYDLGQLTPKLSGWSASLNGSNLFDRHYVASCSGTSYCNWGQGRMVLAGLKYQW